MYFFKMQRLETYPNLKVLKNLDIGKVARKSNSKNIRKTNSRKVTVFQWGGFYFYTRILDLGHDIPALSHRF